jgi:hypothetical protein
MQLPNRLKSENGASEKNVQSMQQQSETLVSGTWDTEEPHRLSDHWMQAAVSGPPAARRSSRRRSEDSISALFCVCAALHHFASMLDDQCWSRVGMASFCTLCPHKGMLQLKFRPGNILQLKFGPQQKLRCHELDLSKNATHFGPPAKRHCGQTF